MAVSKKKENSLLAGLENLTPKSEEVNEQINKPTEIIPTAKIITNVEQNTSIGFPEKKKFGRPRKFKENEATKTIGVKLLASEAAFLEEFGGKYGGKTGYVTHLIRREMERLGRNY